MIKPLRRRQTIGLVAAAIALAGFGAPAFASHDDDGDSYRHGKLFMITNAATGNVVQVYSRAANGPATLIASVASGGSGSGAGLGSQGAVALSGSGRYLFVVNAGSNTLSTFEVRDNALVLKSTVNTGGIRPTSVTENDGLVYVLNVPNGGTGAGNNVVGFRNTKGVLTPLIDGTRALADATQPAQVSFDRDGEALIVSERAATQLVTYGVRNDGTLSASATTTPSPGAVPFGFAITNRNVAVVSEAGTSSASSYKIGGKDAPWLQLVTPALGNGQGAACWVAVTPNGRFAYTANAAASNVSAYGVDGKGAVTLLNAQAGFTSNNGALDMAVTRDGRQLHVFASRTPQQIVSFSIGHDGSLTRLGALNVTAGAGLVAN